MTGSRLAVLITAAALLAGAPAARGQAAGGAAAQISASGLPQDYATNAGAPALTSDPVSRRVLAVWRVRSTQLPTPTLARVLDAHGRPLGAQFVLPGLDNAGGGVDVVSRPRAGGWIVVASVMRIDPPSPSVPAPYGSSTSAVAVVVSADGVAGPRRAISPVERIVYGAGSPTVTGATVSKASIALDPRSGRGVVAWYRTAAPAERGSGVYARGIDAGGRPVTPVRRVYAATGDLPRLAGEVAIGYLSKTRRWVAVWRQRRTGESTTDNGTEEHLVRRVLVTGRPRGPVRSLARSDVPDPEMAGHDGPTVVTDTGSGGALVLLSRGQRFGTPGGRAGPALELVRLGPDGAPLGRRARVVASVSGRPLYPASPRVARDPASGRLVLVYAEGCDPAVKEDCPPQRILAQGLDEDGGRVGGARVLVPEVGDGTVGLARTSAGTLLLAWPGIVLKGDVLTSPDYPPYQPRKSEILVGRAPL